MPFFFELEMKLTRSKKRQHSTPSQEGPKRRRQNSNEDEDQFVDDSYDEESVTPRSRTHVVADPEENEEQLGDLDGANANEREGQTKKDDVKDLLRRMKRALRANWYDHRKFVWTDEEARVLLTDAINHTHVNVPNKAKMTEELFIQQNQNKIFTAMAQLRKNSQTLAFLKYESEYDSLWFIKVRCGYVVVFEDVLLNANLH